MSFPTLKQYSQILAIVLGGLSFLPLGSQAEPFSPPEGDSIEQPNTKPKRWRPGHYMLLFNGAKNPGGQCWAIRNEDNVKGLMARFYWSDIEKNQGEYDWSQLDDLMDQCGRQNKTVFVAIIERTFGGKPDHTFCKAPAYIRDKDSGKGCMASKNGGSLAIQNDDVAEAYITFLKALVRRYDSNDAFGGLQLVESTPGFRKVKRPEGYSNKIYSEKLQKIYKEVSAEMQQSILVPGINFLAGEVQNLVDTAFQAKTGIGGPDVLPTSCTKNGPTVAQQYYAKSYLGKMPAMWQIQSPELVGPFGKCNVSQISEEGQRLKMTHYFWLKIGKKKDSIGWKEDILPAIEKGLPYSESCPEIFENGCT